VATSRRAGSRTRSSKVVTADTQRRLVAAAISEKKVAVKTAGLGRREA
jgi:hypothetical protein